MIDPVQQLLDEHVEIMAEIARLRDAVRDLETHGDLALDRARRVLAGVATMMATRLLTHARKEDEALFPAIERVLGDGAGPTAVMREEHREIHAEAAKFRATLRELNEVEHPAIVAGGESLGRLAAGRASAAELARTGAEVARLLDAHFEKEEQVLFPMCLELLDDHAREDVALRMQEIGEEAAR